MTRIILDAATWSALQSQGAAIVCDPTGRPVGMFQPDLGTALPYGEIPQVGDAEIAETMRNWQGRSLVDIMTDLGRSR